MSIHRRCLQAILITLALTTATGCGEDYKRKRADRMAEKGDWWGAAEIYTELGEREKAAEMHELAMNHGLAAEMFAEAENWKRAAENYDKMADKSKAAEMWNKAGEFEKAGDLWAESGSIDAALAAYQQAELWAKAGLMHEQLGQFDEAAADFEKGGDLSGLGRMLEKAGKPLEAAATYEKGENYRAAAALYEGAEMWADAARNAVALAEHSSGTDAKLQAARMLIKSGEPERATPYFDAALNEAKEFRHFTAVMDISMEANRVRESMDWLLVQADALLAEGRPAVAAEAILALSDVPDAEFRKLKSGQRKQFDSIVDRVSKALDELPEVVNIEGINNFVSFGGGAQTFEYCQFTGSVRNNGEVPFARVELEITMFQKDFDTFVAGQDGWGEIPDELTDKFEAEKSGYRETIEILDLQPGETRPFSQRLGNVVPYKSFSDYISTAELAQ